MKKSGRDKLTALLLTLFLLGGIPVNADLSYVENLLAWYQADAGTYTTATGATPSGNGDPVSRWEDQSGNDYHLRRINAATSPTLQTSAGPLGTPALNFDGDDYLIMSSNGSGSTGFIEYFPDGTTIGTAFIVFKPHAEVTAASPAMALTTFDVSYYVESITLGGQTSLIANELIAARKLQWTGTAWQNTATGVDDDGGARSISNAEYTFLNVTHGVDTFDFRFALGGDSLTDQHSPNRPADPFGPHKDPLAQLTLQVGNSSAAAAYLKGHIVEILLYTTALDGTQRAAVENYLKSKYNPDRGTVVVISGKERP